MGLCIDFETTRGREFDATMCYSTFREYMQHRFRTRCQLGLANKIYGRKAQVLYYWCWVYDKVPDLDLNEDIVSAMFC